ncbi:hypothetical protein DRJ17_01940 [Candidatus Woesearchaeota archaeon]|nr:MAG: hypothetical protein DRJ17_01940 [Candidatus Woesearchaeota archaeon]
MGKIKYQQEIESFIKKNQVFHVKDIKRLISSKNADPDYAYLILHNLERKGKVNRIIKGYYTTHDDPMLLAYCIKPSYIGLESALSIYGLWEQEANVVLITPRRVRQGLRQVFNTNVVVHLINKKHFFGYHYIDYYDFKLPVSDIEKTFLDWIDFKRYLSKELIKTFKKNMNKNKLKRYLKHYDKRFATKVNNALKQS